MDPVKAFGLGNRSSVRKIDPAIRWAIRLQNCDPGTQIGRGFYFVSAAGGDRETDARGRTRPTFGEQANQAWDKESDFVGRLALEGLRVVSSNNEIVGLAWLQSGNRRIGDHSNIKLVSVCAAEISVVKDVSNHIGVRTGIPRERHALVLVRPRREAKTCEQCGSTNESDLSRRESPPAELAKSPQHPPL